MFGKGRNILDPLPKCRHVDGKEIQAVEQVLAEQAFLDGVREVAVCCRDHAHIDFDRLDSTQALELHLLQDAQNLGLRARIHVANFVEEDCALVDQFLSCSGFAPDENSSRRCRDAADQAKDLLDCATSSDNALNSKGLADLLFERLELDLQTPAFERSLYDDFHFLHLERLHEIVVGAASNGLHDHVL